MAKLLLRIGRVTHLIFVMSTVSISTSTSQSMSAPAPVANKDPLAGMTLLTAQGQQPRAKAAIEITKNALKRIRVAMAKEGISPDAGGLRVGIQGGGCSGLSYNIRFDTQPRERDRVYAFGAGLATAGDPTNGAPIRITHRSNAFFGVFVGSLRH